MIRSRDADPKSAEPTGPATDLASGRVVERPDGYHAIALDGHQEFGPFETFAQARASIEAAFEGFDGETAVEDGTLMDMGGAVGTADWLDPQTGEPAEGACPPHLDAE